MAADITDKFSKIISGTTRPVATTLSAQKLIGATTASLTAATGWDTDTAVHGIMYRTDAGTGAKVAGSQIDWKATLSGTTLSNFTVTAGTDDTYAIGATVELAPTAAWGDDLVTGILVEHNQDGTHDEAIITSRTEDTSPATGDLILTSDASATNALKKVQIGNITPYKSDKSVLTTDSNPYKFSAYLSSNTAIASATQKIALGSELFDTNSNFDSTTNYRYTAPVGGFYQIDAQAGIGTSGMGANESAVLALYKNGSLLLRSEQVNGSGDAFRLPRPRLSGLIQLSASDYLELYVIMGGVYRDITGGSSITYFTGYLVSRT